MTIFKSFPLLIIHYSLFIAFSAFSQENNSLQVEKIRERNNVYNQKIEAQTKIAKDYYSKAKENITAAKIIITNISEKSSSADADKEMATVLINKSKKYTLKLDSVYQIACKYKDSIKANDAILTKLTGKPYKSYPLDTLEIENGELGNQVSNNKTVNEQEQTYTVQIASDTKSDSPFKNIENVKVIKCKDGYYRYISGEFKTYEEASKLQQNYINKGYKNSFVTTMQTIEKLKK